ncbi:hypothetical protein SLEP1_g4719 [Rubroshorea leprosula]|uniref:Uncharacterized protein n=1 Tax=Rubroshorea leprosula TaxID=152421 RepID=A0AAV5HQ19_9ROSI|nr:hypothetical protein SLEP1_g4719 [Rubroshorea leprosula]
MTLPNSKKLGITDELQKLVNELPFEVIKHQRDEDTKALAASLKSDIPAMAKRPTAPAAPQLDNSIANERREPKTWAKRPTASAAPQLDNSIANGRCEPKTWVCREPASWVPHEPRLLGSLGGKRKKKGWRKEKPRKKMGWDPANNRHVRDAFLNCMKHRWSDNLRDEKLKWDKNSAYVPCWIPTHIWPHLLTYWDSDEYKRLNARGAKNRSSGERVTHTTGSISVGIHEMWMDTYVVECTESHGSDASSWPRMDNEAGVKAVGGCSSNFMLGIGSQVNPKMAKDHEELERQRQQITLMQQQLANITKAQNNMSQTIAQSVAATLAAHGISPQAGHHPVDPPQPSHGPGSGLRTNSAFTYSTDSTQTSPMVPEY